jgi:hypothetical protein
VLDSTCQGNSLGNGRSKMSGFNKFVFAEDVQVGQKVAFNGAICKVIRVNKNFGAFGDYVVIDFFAAEVGVGAYFNNQVFQFGDSFVKVDEAAEDKKFVDDHFKIVVVN